MVEFLENILAFSLKQDLVCSHQSLAEERLLDPWSWLEGSYKIGSVCPSSCLHVSFLGIASFDFSETQLNVRGHIQLCETAGFLGKNRHLAKMVKNCPKTWFLDFLRKLCHQFCLENQSSYGPLISCKNCMLGKNLVLKLETKMALGQ